MIYLAWFTLVLSGLGLFLSLWIVVPAPTMVLLPLAVGAPEISPILLLGNAAVLSFALYQSQGGGIRIVAIAICTLSLIFSSLPLLQLPATVQQTQARMQSVLGKATLEQQLEAPQGSVRDRPFAWRDLIQGIPVPPIQPNRQVLTLPDGSSLSLEIYQDQLQDEGMRPTLITIYGGAWQRGEPGQTARFSRYMAAQGYVVVAIDYRHAPQHRFPTQLYDVQAALQWVASHANDYGIDMTRLAMVGWSSGAHLALLSTYQAQGPPIRAVVGYYGPTHLAAGYREPPVPDPINSRAVLKAFLGGPPEELPDLYRQASPLHQARQNLPPTMLIYGSRDHLVKPKFGQQLDERLRSLGNSSILIALPWSEHAFDAVFNGLGNQIALYHVERFLSWALQ